MLVKKQPLLGVIHKPQGGDFKIFVFKEASFLDFFFVSLLLFESLCWTFEVLSTARSKTRKMDQKCSEIEAKKKSIYWFTRCSGGRVGENKKSQ